MVKEILACAGGVAVGVALCYGGYCLYKRYLLNVSSEEEEDVFAERLKNKEAESKRLRDLFAAQSYVELLTARELTSWFKENRGQFAEKTKMLIVTPTVENMRGLGYPSDSNLDVDTSVVQLFYDGETGEVLKIRLVNFTDIDSNLQAQLIEHEGMMVVTD